MPERPHPERRPEGQLRPVVEIIAGRESLQRTIDTIDSVTTGQGQTLEWQINLERTLSSLNTHPQNKKAVREIFPLELAEQKGSAWRDSLRYAAGDEGVGQLSTWWLHKQEGLIPEGNIQQSVRPFHEVARAQTAVSELLCDLEDKKKRKLLQFAEEQRNMQGQEGSAQDFNTFEDYVDYQLSFGEAKSTFTQSSDFIRPFLYEPEVMHSGVIILYECEKAAKEALDWVLGEDDGNNGLAKMLAEQRENPLR